jgi:Ca2+-binding RTX toxin-like protein
MRATSHIAVESLEDRKLFATTVELADGVLRIEGDARRNNRIVVATGRDGDTVEVSINRGRPTSFAPDDVQSIEIVGGSRNDDISIDEYDGELGIADIRINGGRGNDRIVADWSPVTIWGGGDRDTILGSRGDDLIYGEDGNDAIWGDGGHDTIWAGSGNDRVYGEDGNDDLYGERGWDRIEGGRGDDYLDGGRDNDVLVDYVYDGDRNVFVGGSGWDDFYISRTDTVRDEEWTDRVFVADDTGDHWWHGRGKSGWGWFMSVSF